MIKYKYDTSKEIYAYMSLSYYFMFSQMSEKKGIKQFGEQVVAAMLK